MFNSDYNLNVFRKDFLSGLIVFFIALPLCLGIAQASHVPLFSGIIAGIIGGVLVGALSGSHFSVSGPAAGLIALVSVIITEVHSFDIFLCSVIIAGIAQVALGYLKAGAVANYIPSSVLEGLLAGIGLIIIIKQLPDALGYVFNNNALMVDVEDSFVARSVTMAMHHIQSGALIISVVGLALLIIWKKFAPGKLASLPAGISVIIVGILLNQLFIANFPAIGLDADHLVKLHVAASASDFFSQFTLPDFNGFLTLKVWENGLLIAGLASVETLLCIEATDKLDPLKRYTPADRELKAQGIGNMVSGLLGGLPITSVIMRSSANVGAGAKTKASTIIHGALLLLCVAGVPVFLNLIPKAAIAVILIYTGYKMCTRHVMHLMWQGGKTQFIPFVATALGVLFLGMIKGVGIGLLISLFYTLKQNIIIPYYYKRSTFNNGELIKLMLSQEVSFLNKASIKETLEHLPRNSKVIIDATYTEFIDYDVLELIRDFATTGANERGIVMSLTGFKESYNLPKLKLERELLAGFVDSDEIPVRTSGSYQKLIKQLRNNIIKPKNG